MASNLRSKSIQGYITDSAGNILRNASIVIKTANPTTGSIIVDSIKSDDNGYFISNPIPDGTYDIYESGIRIVRTYHVADKSKIQCYKPVKGTSFPQDNLMPFETLAADKSLNDFKRYLQIEPDFIDVFQFGSTFPIYNLDISSIVDTSNALYNIGKFFGFGPNSRITTTRFDIEYYVPLTSLNTQYKRIRFAGVPGLKFFEHSKLLVPIDYYSLVASLPKFYIYNALNITATEGVDVDVVVLDGGGNSEYANMLPFVSVGDIIELKFTSSSWYGIVCLISDETITLVKWKSSRFTSTTNPFQTIEKVYLYDGIFQNIDSVDETNNERFTVVENTYAQNLGSELYTYS